MAVIGRSEAGGCFDHDRRAPQLWDIAETSPPRSSRLAECASHLKIPGTNRGSPMAVMWSLLFGRDHEGWRDQAACRSVDAQLFFPAGSTGAAIDWIRSAKAVCRSCPVHDPCLQFALETNQEAGVWGGKDEDERRRLREVWRSAHRPMTSAFR